MSNNILLPSLSPDGWVQSTAEQADYLISHFFEAEYSQTHIYEGYVSSFPWLIRQYQSDMTGLTSATMDTLSRYFGAYFDNVQVDCAVNEIIPASSQINLSIYVAFTDKNGKDFILSRALDILNSKIAKVIALNNNGPVI